MRKALAATFLAALLSSFMTSASAEVAYQVTVDTSSFSALAGYLDIQFNPGNDSAPLAHADLHAFASDAVLQPVATVDGQASGALPGNLALDNGTAFNAVLQPIVFGTGLSFHVAFNGPWLTANSGAGTAFSLNLLDTGFNPLFGDTALALDLVPGGSATFSTLALPQVMVSPVPEPQSWLLMLIALGVIGSRLSGRGEGRA